MNVLSERLKKAFDILGLNGSSFGTKYPDANISKPTVYNALSAKGEPTFESVSIICEAIPSISAEYLLRGIGDPIKQVYEIGDTDPCAKYKDHIRKQSQQNDEVLE